MRPVEKGMPAEREGHRLPVIHWMAGAAVAAVALLGVLIIVVLIAVALQPPGWVQTLLGAIMAFGAASLAWLVANALEARGEEERPGPHLVGGGRNNE